MKVLSAELLNVVSGGDGSSTQQPTQTGTDSNGNPIYSCPTGTFPAQLPNGQVVCVKPNS